MAETNMSTKGQIVIPAEIRRELGLGRHSRLRVDREGDRIVLTPIRDADWRAARGSLAPGGDLIADLEAERRTERQAEREARG